ncbi:TPA: TMEM165/GDT1 family protein [Candidatus Bathyarchaeota archaeon]|nr:TMEM165/GDT1 family protein [Candidatus Bathyarchaeota archaeon]
MGTIFLMEMADKTQLSAASFSAKISRPTLVYLATVVGLALASVISVVFGRALALLLPEKYLRYLVGTIFILTGVLTVIGR